MEFFESCKSFVLHLALLFSPLSSEFVDRQHVISSHVHRPSGSERPQLQGVSFPAPQGPESGDQFICEYPNLDAASWSTCSPSSEAGCWLQGPDDQSYDIRTDYETTWPQGITREYTLTAAPKSIDGDGIPNPDGKVFNGIYPGPRIQACWGDTVKVTVVNKLQYNGTTVHWHGIRQLGSPEMDGVNAITQCPIAENDSYTYTFNATQYGMSWYHSHYSLQYADGLLGPITIYGPTSSLYDEAKDPILLSDWTHRSAFKDWHKQLTGQPSYPKANSVLLNGQGNFAGQFPGKIYTTAVEKRKRYLLRIINTSLDTDYIFSIDNHNFTVVSADFVPIIPYWTNSLNIAIGQRYQVVLDAVPNDQNGENPPDGSYWIRAIPATGCSGFEKGNEPGERQGILYYTDQDMVVPTTTRPTYDLTCKDEPYASIRPIVPWDITPTNITTAPRYDIGKPDFPNYPVEGNKFYWFAFGDHPMWLNFSDPMITNLENDTWPDTSVVIPETTPAGEWVYMIVTAPSTPPPNSKKNVGYFPVAHPMHLHGHDFAILAQGTNSSVLPDITLNFDNPPRRDTVLIPSSGWVAIAFKADNPGAWLFHCHIPWHASNGLALTVLERQADFQAMMTPARLAETQRVCGNWTNWYSNSSNWWDPKGPFQDDSGI